jgi:hypothetical protein
MARQTSINKVQSRALVRADTTISNFSAKHQLINFISRRSGGHNTNTTPSPSRKTLAENRFQKRNTTEKTEICSI